MCKVFARKIIRLSHRISKEEVENEARVVSALCEKSKNANIVQVVEHGWLCGAFNVYYIDMELGAFALADYICYLGGEREGDGVKEFVQRNESSLVDNGR